MPPTTPTRFAAELTQVRMAATGSGVRSRYARAWGVGCSRPPALDRSKATGRRTCPSSCSSSSSTSRTRQSPTLARARGGQGAGFRLRLAPRALLPLHGLRRFVGDGQAARGVPARRRARRGRRVRRPEQQQLVVRAITALTESSSSLTLKRMQPLRTMITGASKHSDSAGSTRREYRVAGCHGCHGGVRHSSCLSRGCSTWGMCRDVVNYAVYWP